MNTPDVLIPAIRQYKHNHGEGDFVFGYDMEEANAAVITLQEENEKLKALLEDVKEDLLLRADIVGAGIKVVNLSSSIWMRVKEVTK